MPLWIRALSLSLRQLLTLTWRQEDERRLHAEGQRMASLGSWAIEWAIIPIEHFNQQRAPIKAQCFLKAQGNRFCACSTANLFYSNMRELTMGLDKQLMIFSSLPLYAFTSHFSDTDFRFLYYLSPSLTHAAIYFSGENDKELRVL